MLCVYGFGMITALESALAIIPDSVPAIGWVTIVFAIVAGLLGLLWKTNSGRIKRLEMEVDGLRKAVEVHAEKAAADKVESDRRIHERLDQIVNGLHALEVRMGEKYLHRQEIGPLIGAVVAEHERSCQKRIVEDTER